MKTPLKFEYLKNLKQLALYDGSDHLAELSVPGNIVAGEITFSGLSFTADDIAKLGET